MGLRFGDYRDLNAMDAWADDIAARLKLTAEVSHIEKRS
jgi:hypothetical protein